MSGHAGSSKETLCSANMHFFSSWCYFTSLCYFLQFTYELVS